MAGQVADRQQVGEHAVDRLQRLGEVHGPDRAGVVPGEFEAVLRVTLAPDAAVTAQQVFENAPRHVPEQRLQGRQADGRPRDTVQEAVDLVARGHIDFQQRTPPVGEQKERCQSPGAERLAVLADGPFRRPALTLSPPAQGARHDLQLGGGTGAGDALGRYLFRVRHGLSPRFHLGHPPRTLRLLTPGATRGRWAALRRLASAADLRRYVLGRGFRRRGLDDTCRLLRRQAAIGRGCTGAVRLVFRRDAARTRWGDGERRRDAERACRRHGDGGV